VGAHTLTTGPAAALRPHRREPDDREGAHLVSLTGGTLTLGGPLLTLATGPDETTPTVSIGGDLLHVASTVTGPPSGSLVGVGAGSLTVAGTW